jgi:hypothetical protein
MLMFAQIRASTVAAASTEALPVSVRRKLRSGVSMPPHPRRLLGERPPGLLADLGVLPAGRFSRGGSHVSIRDLDDVTCL